MLGEFLSSDGKSSIRVRVWETENPALILQIVHGMAEHIDRYDVFAEYMNGFGITVVGHDQIGHGRSAEPKDYGYFGKADGWKHFIEDVESLRKTVRTEHPELPYFMLGHSMGSFVVRGWLKMFKEGIDGAVLTGTAGSNPALGAGKALVALLRKIKGDRHLSKLVSDMAFGNYRKRIPDAKAEYDWLSRDREIVDKYTADPACGFTFTLAGYADLFNLIGYIQGSEWAASIPKEIPYLLASGEEDPVGTYGAGPAEVLNLMENAGCGDVSLLLYQGMRHEVLNEIGKEIVMEDIRRFLLDEE